jgi:catechol 2,3-dioxygenase-like lactoylglutathione lyase family enzyme
MVVNLNIVEGSVMQVLFVAGFGPIVRDREASRRLYGDSLGIRLDAEADGYLHTEGLAGVKTFALWPLSQAAESCFGVPEWPEYLPIPQAWLEFDVDDLDAATVELRAKGYTLLVAARREPWGQTVTRLLAPEGILVGVTHTPWLRDPDADVEQEAVTDAGAPPHEETT